MPQPHESQIFPKLPNSKLSEIFTEKVVSYTFQPFKCFYTLAGICTDSLSEVYIVAM